MHFWSQKRHLLNVIYELCAKNINIMKRKEMKKAGNVEERESWRCFKKLSKDVKAFKCPTKFFSGKKPFFQQLDEKEEKIEQS